MSATSAMTLAHRHDPCVRLVCFPHAGGGAGSFRGWSGRLPEWVEVVGAQLPGRETRFWEDPHHRVETLVPDLVDGLTGGLSRCHTVLLGHDMGALLAYEVARELRRRGLDRPLGLVVSGQAAPHREQRVLGGRAETRDDLIALVRAYRGTPRPVLDDRDLLELYLPTIRADVDLVESYDHVPGAPLDVPIATYTAGGDDLAAEAARSWGRYTTAGLTRHRVAGEQHLPYDEEDFLADVTGDLSRWLAVASTEAAPALVA
jgi:medium-chain acyl-[acyl-carrier-protein] hydrolase